LWNIASLRYTPRRPAAVAYLTESSRFRKQEFADSLNIPFLETSAKDSTNVDEMFYTMTRLIQEQYVTLALLMDHD